MGHKFITILFLFFVTIIEAQICKLFTETQVSSSITITPGLSLLGIGSEYIAVYLNTSFAVIGQRISMNGSLIGSEVVLTSPGCRFYPWIIKFNDTAILLAYVESNCTFFYFQTFSADLSVSGPRIQGNAANMSASTFVSGKINILNNSNIFVTYWITNQLYGQIFYQNGTLCKSQFQINTISLLQHFHFVEVLNNGSIMLAYPDYIPLNIYAILLSSDGNVIVPEFQVNSVVNGSFDPRIVSFSDNSFFISYTGNGGLVYYRIFSPSLPPSVEKLLTELPNLDTATYPILLPNNRFVTSYNAQTPYNKYIKFYDSNGTNYTGDYQINTANVSHYWYTPGALLNSTHLGFIYYNDSRQKVYFQSFVIDDGLPSYPNYNDSIGRKVCNPCVPPCFTCTDTTCLTCIWPQILINNSCYCPPGPYPTLILNSSSPCQNQCLAPFQNITVNGGQVCNTTCTSGYLNKNGTCNSTCLQPYTIVGNIYCSEPCQPGFFYYSNGSCLATCDLPLNVQITNQVSTCINTCNFYIYSNFSCIAICATPRIVRNETGMLFCDDPCLSGQYFYLNGTCLTVCPSPRIPHNRSGILFCDDPCPSGQYFYWNGTCSFNCSIPLVPVIIDQIAYCNLPCNQSLYYYSNGSCLTSCSLPLHVQITNSVTSCINTCNFYIYSNFSCITGCLPPRIPRNRSGILFCDDPCASGQCVDWNGICTSTCPSPHSNVTIDQIPVCLLCPGTEAYYWDNTCAPTCVPPGISSGAFCNPPCNISQYLLIDGSCENSCPPLNNYINFKGINVCQSPCSASLYYLIANNTCVPTCSFPYQYENRGTFNICASCVPRYFWNDTYCVRYTNITITQLADFPNRLLIVFDRPMNLSLDLFSQNFQLIFPATPNPNVSFEYQIFDNQTAYINLIPLFDLSPQNILIHIINPSLILSIDQIPMNQSNFTFFCQGLILQCPEYCDECLSTVTCKKCTQGFISSGGKCYYQSLALIYQVIQDQQNPNKIYLNFNDDIIFSSYDFQNLINLTLGDISPSRYNYTIRLVDNKTFCIDFYPTVSFQPDSLEVNFKTGNWMQSKLGLPLLHSSSQTQGLKKMIATAQMKQIQDAVNAISSPSTSVAVSVVVTSNPALLWILVSLMQNYYFILFLNLELPINLLMVLNLLKITSLNIMQVGFPPLFSDPSTDTLPKFLDQGIGSSFLYNCIGNIMLIMMFTVLYFVAVYSLKYFRFLPVKVAVMLNLFVDAFKRNTAFNLWQGSIMNFAVSIQLQFFFMSDTYLGSVISVLFAHIFLVVNCSIIYYFYQDITTVRKGDNNKKAIVFIQESLSELRPESGIGYYTICVVASKKLIAGIFLVLFYNYPFLQLLSQAICSLLMGFFYAARMPFIKPLKNFLGVVNEFSDVVMYILILISQFYLDDTETWLMVGWMACYWMMCGLAVNILFAMSQSLTDIPEFLKTIRKRIIVFRYGKLLKNSRKIKRKFQSDKSKRK